MQGLLLRLQLLGLRVQGLRFGVERCRLTGALSEKL